MLHKKLHQEHIDSIIPGVLMVLDDQYPVLVVAKPFMKNWFVAANIEVTYYWVEVLHEDNLLTIEMERLRHITSQED